MAKKVKYTNGSLIEYEILPLVDFYDPILRTPTIPFDFNKYSSDQLESILYSLVETLNAESGLGLSANQVGMNHRICAINMGNQYWVMINPYIIEKTSDIADFSEGCLSYPGLYIKTNRSKHIKVRFQSIDGQEVEKEFDGLTAVVVQHELDHLDGVVFTDRVNPIKLDQAKRKAKSVLKKMKRARIAKNQEAETTPA